MYQKNPTSNSKSHYLYIALGLAVLLGVLLFTLEKTGVTNFYTSTPSVYTSDDNTIDTLSTTPTNKVDYGPAKTEDATSVPDKSSSPTPAAPTNPDLSVVITNTRKSGDLYLIKAVISGTDSATCTATMSNGSQSATGSSGAGMIEAQYSCKDLSIPLSQLVEPGEWKLDLVVTDKNGATASESIQVIM